MPDSTEYGVMFVGYAAYLIARKECRSTKRNAAVARRPRN
jgi:hypothetical protein